MRTRFVRRAALAAAVVLPSLALAWGESGHRIVGEIAYKRLSTNARSEIDQLLATEQTNLPDCAFWPDAVARSQPEYRFANPLHYANVPRGSTSYDPSRDRPSAGDVVSAIDRFAAVLADTNETPAKRLEALRFLTHFVGDIHQPLHVGYAEDKGGNEFWVKFYNRRMKLHAVWDTGILEKSGISWQDYATDLNAAVTAQDVASYTERMDPLDWAQETYRLAVNEAYGSLQQNDQIARAYVDEKLPVVEDQLSIAGVRLAAMINAMFPDTTSQPQPGTPATVYVTTSGAKYHAAGCRYLSGPHSPIPLDEARRNKEPCSVCDPPR